MDKLPKTKSELAHHMGISLSTLKRWLKKEGLNVPRGIISPQKVSEILIRFGFAGTPEAGRDGYATK